MTADEAERVILAFVENAMVPTVEYIHNRMLGFNSFGHPFYYPEDLRALSSALNRLIQSGRVRFDQRFRLVIHAASHQVPAA